MTERKRGDKQIMGRGGVPVEIIRNPESERHSNKITLAVGGIETIGAINERVHAEETVLLSDATHSLMQKPHGYGCDLLKSILMRRVILFQILGA